MGLCNSGSTTRSKFSKTTGLNNPKISQINNKHIEVLAHVKVAVSDQESRIDSIRKRITRFSKIILEAALENNKDNTITYLQQKHTLEEYLKDNLSYLKECTDFKDELQSTYEDWLASKNKSIENSFLLFKSQNAKASDFQNISKKERKLKLNDFEKSFANPNLLLILLIDDELNNQINEEWDKTLKMSYNFKDKISISNISLSTKNTQMNSQELHTKDIKLSLEKNTMEPLFLLEPKKAAINSPKDKSTNNEIYSKHVLLKIDNRNNPYLN